MLARLVGSGMLNPAIWVAVATLLYPTLFRSLRTPRRMSLVVVIGLAACAGLSLAAGLYRSYAVPRDVLQDIIAAREYLAGRSMSPQDMNILAREVLAEEGPRASLFTRWPDAAKREHEQFEEMLREHWVQAHPPLMTLAIAPLVAAFGVLGTQVAIAVLTAIALSLTLWLLMRELWPEGGTLAHAAVVFVVLGWAPVIGVFRLQQPGLILVALLTAAWACLRRGKHGWFAGVLVAVAAGLKLVPGLLAFPLIVRHRRAAIALVVASVLLLTLILALVPLADIREYHATTSGVIDEYASYPTMISVLGVYARWGKQLGFSPNVAEGLWLITLTAVVGGWACLLLRRSRLRPDPRREIDYEFAVGMSLIPWLSPIAWDHYEVFLLLPLAVLAGHVFRKPSRFSRVCFGLLLVAVAVPDGLFLSAFDYCREAGWRSLQVWVLEPLRAFVGITLTAWLLLAWLKGGTKPDRGDELLMLVLRLPPGRGSRRAARREPAE